MILLYRYIQIHHHTLQIPQRSYQTEHVVLADPLRHHQGQSTEFSDFEAMQREMTRLRAKDVASMEKLRFMEKHLPWMRDPERISSGGTINLSSATSSEHRNVGSDESYLRFDSRKRKKSLVVLIQDVKENLRILGHRLKANPLLRWEDAEDEREVLIKLQGEIQNTY